MDTARLAAVPLLASLTPEQLETAMDHLDLLEVAAGTPLISQGEPSPGLFLVLHGEVAVQREVDGHQRDTAVLGPNAFFGEMSRSATDVAQATVLARTDAKFAVLPRERFDVLDRLPGLRDHLDDVAERRRVANRVAGLVPVTVDTGKVEIRLRPLWPDDWRLMEASKVRTSDESLRRRFFSVPNLTEYTMRRLANVDWTDHFAWAALTDANGDGVDDLGAIARYARLVEDPTAAEVAFLVIDDLQGLGIGRLLVGALAVAASRHGIVDFTATALADNGAIRHLLADFGATWTPGDRGQEVSARWPVAATLEHTDPALRRLLEPLVDLTLGTAPAGPT